MSRDELVAIIITEVGATTTEQTDKVDSSLNDIVLLIQLRFNHEILISEMKDADIKNIKRETVRRYKT